MLTRLKTISRTLRFRLMAWNVVVVVLTAAAILASLRGGVRYALYHELDQLHAEDTRQIALMLEKRPPDYPQLFESLQQHAEGHLQHGWFVVLFDQADQILWASKNAPAEAFEIPDLKPGIAVAENDEIRFLRTLFDSPQGDIAAIHVGSKLQSIRNEMARVDRQVALAAGIVLLVAPPCGYWLAGRATKPLSNMIRASIQLRPSHLEERLPLGGTGDELDQLTDNINGLLDRIADNVERKQDLLANAAHQLRTPLAAIRSSIEVTLNEPRSTSEYEELLGELIEENSHLENLVNQLLLLSETEADGPSEHSQLISLHEAVQRSVEMFGGVAEAKGLTLTSDLQPCRVRGNLDHLRQVINNLLDNAIKFTPSGGHIDVKVRPSVDLQLVEIIITDTGHGIPPADQQRIFERFFRSKQVSDEKNISRGTGLGLSICLAVIAAHHGTIDVESEVGVGTTFIVKLPACNPSSP